MTDAHDSPPAVPGSTRADFTARVRAAAGTPPAGDRSPPEVPDALVRLTVATTDLVALFASKARASGMGVHVCAERDLSGALEHVLTGLGARRATTAIADPTLRARVGGVLASARIDPIDAGAQAGLDAHFDADCGITDVKSAIAETGTLVLSSEGQGRGAWLVPPVHIAVVRAAKILPDMLDLWKPGATPAAMPASVVLVSGPSKTADIEGILITGVHGPREVHVLVINPSP